jgi:hypothetical protein
MRFFITIGGSLGFALTLFSSLHAGNAPAFALRDGAIGCIVGAVLLRGAHWAFIKSIQSFVVERAATLREQAAARLASAANPET